MGRACKTHAGKNKGLRKEAFEIAHQALNPDKPVAHFQRSHPSGAEPMNGSALKGATRAIHTHSARIQEKTGSSAHPSSATSYQ